MRGNFFYLVISQFLVFSCVWGQQFEMRTVVPLSEAEGFVVVFLDDREAPTAVMMKYFNGEEELLAERTVTLDHRGLYAQYEGVLDWAGKICLITSLYYPGPKRNHLIFQQFDLPTLGEVRRELIDEAYTPQQFRIPFGFDLSPDRSRIMFYSWTYTLPKDPGKVSIKVFDQEMNLDWERRYILPFLNEKLYIYGCHLKNNRQVMLLCENYEASVSRRVDLDRVEHFALQMEPDSEDVLKYDINLPDMTIRGLKVQMLPDDRLVGAAFYHPPKKRQIEGLYLFEVTPDGSAMDRRRLSISDDRYDAAFAYGEKDHFLNANRHKFVDYEVDAIYEQDNGSMVVIGEQRVARDQFYDIEYNDILVVRTDPDRRQAAQVVRIPKRQRGGAFSTAVYSYYHFERNGYFYFMFNDRPDNYQNNQPANTISLFDEGRASFMMVGLNPEGNYRITNLSGLMRGLKVSEVWPTRCWRVSDDRLLMYGERAAGFSASGLIFPIDLTGIIHDRQ